MQEKKDTESWIKHKRTYQMKHSGKTAPLADQEQVWDVDHCRSIRDDQGHLLTKRGPDGTDPIRHDDHFYKADPWKCIRKNTLLLIAAPPSSQMAQHLGQIFRNLLTI